MGKPHKSFPSSMDENNITEDTGDMISKSSYTDLSDTMMRLLDEFKETMVHTASKAQILIVKMMNSTTIRNVENEKHGKS